MNGYLAGLLAILSGIAVAVVGELISEEVRDRLDQVPRAILRLAARWLDPGQRITVYRDEWEPELIYILKGTEARPVTRLITGSWYALGILVNTRRIARHLRRPAPGASKASAGHGRVLARSLSGLLPGALLPRRIAYQVHLDERVAADDRGSWQITDGESGTLVPDPSLVVLSVSNPGRRRVKADGLRDGSVAFTFGERQVVSVKIRGLSSPDAMPRILGEPGIQVAGNSVVLPAVSMNRGDSFQLLVLLSDAGAGVTVASDLADVHFTRGRPHRALRSRVTNPLRFPPW